MLLLLILCSLPAGLAASDAKCDPEMGQSLLQKVHTTLSMKAGVEEEAHAAPKQAERVVQLAKQLHEEFFSANANTKGLQLLEVDAALPKHSDGNPKHLAAAEHLVSALAANLLAVGAGGNGTDTMLQEILDLLQGIKDSYHTEHDQDVRSLSDITDAFETCKTVVSDAFAAGGDVKVKEDLMTSDETAHQQCRVTQNTRRTTHNNKCGTARNSWTGAPTCALNKPTAWPSLTSQTSLVDCLDSWKTWYDAQYSNQVACKNAIEAWETINTTCQNKQTSFEGAFCTFAEKKESTCTEQDHCFAYLTALRSHRKTEVETNRDVRIDGFTSAERIECLVNALASHANETHAHKVNISVCQNKIVDTSDFSVTFPALPTKTACTPEANKPCDQAWKNVYYTSTKIPTLSTTPVGTCSACSASAAMKKCSLPVSDPAYDTSLCTPVGIHSTLGEAACTPMCAAGYGGVATDTCNSNGGQFSFGGCNSCSSFASASCPLQCSNQGGTCQQCSSSNGCQAGRQCSAGSCVASTAVRFPPFITPAEVMFDFTSQDCKDGKWKERVSNTEYTIPAGASIGSDYLNLKGKAMSAPLKTSPNQQAAVTYAIRMRLNKATGNLGWVVSQYPDYGWSRAITVSDGRLGQLGQTPGGSNAQLGAAPLGEWFTLIGVWTGQGKLCRTWFNDKRGADRTCRNGGGNRADETIIIGGRGVSDGSHNPQDMDVSRAVILNYALTDAQIPEFLQAFNGLPPATPAPAPVLPLPTTASYDFEGTLDGWTILSTCATNKPSYGGSPQKVGTPDARDNSGQHGEYILRSQNPGFGNDWTKGILESPEFKFCATTEVKLLVGGGTSAAEVDPENPNCNSNSVRTQLEYLDDDGKWKVGGGVVSSGVQLKEKSMTITGKQGKTGRIRLYDLNAGGWGHNLVDYVRILCQ